MDWKRPFGDTYSVVKYNWLMLVHGPNYTHEHEELDKSRENYPEHWTKNDMADNRGARHR